MPEMKKRRSFSWTELSRELKRRHVYTVVATYAVVSWVLLQIGEVTFGPLHLPEWVMSRLVVLVIIGFPIVVVLAWFFDLTRKGIRLTPKLTFNSGEDGDERPSIAGGLNSLRFNASTKHLAKPESSDMPYRSVCISHQKDARPHLGHD